MKSFFKHKGARHSATASLEASASVPDSGFAFINNAQGASASIVELANALDDVLNDIEFEGEASEFAKAEIALLDREASKYSNSRFTAGARHPIWSCDSEDAPMLLAAAKCSAAIYKPEDTTILTEDVYGYKRLRYNKPSILGTVKAMGFYEARQLDPTDSKQRRLCIIAIRGSASNVDHMVNVNNEPTEVGDFFPLSTLQESGEEIVSPQAHSGFVAGAKALMHQVAEQLDSCVKNNGPDEILFTGHSAGAAVASLLFHHFLSSASKKYPSLKFSCITFGSPPFCNTAFATSAGHTRADAANCRLHLNFLNEFDVVPRLDRTYVLSLVDLYRSKFGLPPVDSNNGLLEYEPESSDETTGASSKVWPLPAPIFVHPGDTILLYLGNAAGDADGRVGIRATQIDSVTLGSLLYCRTAAHKVAVYLANVGKLCARDGER